MADQKQNLKDYQSEAIGNWDGRGKLRDTVSERMATENWSHPGDGRVHLWINYLIYLSEYYQYHPPVQLPNGGSGNARRY